MYFVEERQGVDLKIGKEMYNIKSAQIHEDGNEDRVTLFYDKGDFEFRVAKSCGFGFMKKYLCGIWCEIIDSLGNSSHHRRICRNV